MRLLASPSSGGFTIAGRNNAVNMFHSLKSEFLKSAFRPHTCGRVYRPPPPVISTHQPAHKPLEVIRRLAGAGTAGGPSCFRCCPTFSAAARRRSWMACVSSC